MARTMKQYAEGILEGARTHMMHAVYSAKTL